MRKNYIKFMASAMAVLTLSSAAAIQGIPHMTGFSSDRDAMSAIASPLPCVKESNLPLAAKAMAANPGLLSRAAAPANEISIPENAELLLHQDFSLVTEGSETELGPDMVPNYVNQDPYISSEYMGEEGWWGFGVYAAGGAVALAYPGYGGALNTPMMNMNGRVFVKIRVKAMEANTTQVPFYLNCLKGSLFTQEAVSNIPMGMTGSSLNLFRVSKDEGWVEYIAMIYCLNEDDNSWVQINATTYSKGLLVDQIDIYRDYDLCTAPSNLYASDFTADGFTASWTPGLNNDSYLLSLKEERKTGMSETFHVTFDNVKVDDNGVIITETLPEGVEAWLDSSFPQISTDMGKDGSPAILLHSMSEMIVLPSNGLGIKSASFYAQSESYDGSWGMLYIIGFFGSGSRVAGGITLPSLVEGKQINVYDYVDGLSDYDAFGFMLQYPSEDEFVAISDISWTTVAPTETTLVREDVPVDGNVCVLTGLDPECDYSFSVKGVSESGLISEATQFTQAIGCPVPVVLPAEDIQADGSFTARWNPSPKAESYEVKNYKIISVKEDTPDCVILEDNFEGAYTHSFDDVEYVLGDNLDGIADLPGWSANVAFYADGGVGTLYNGDLISPTMNLSHNGGKFKVRIVARIISGCGIVVQCNQTSYQVIMAPGTIDDLVFESEEYELEFEDGTDMTRLMFYSLDGNGYLIENVQVLQDLEAGDSVTSPIEQVYAEGHDTDSHSFSGLEVSKDFSYAYSVTAVSTYGSYIYRSAESGLMPVDFTQVSVDRLSADSSISVCGLNVSVNLPGNVEIRVFDIAGRVVSAIDGKEGINTLTLPASGTYLVKYGDRIAKIFAR